MTKLTIEVLRGQILNWRFYSELSALGRAFDSSRETSERERRQLSVQAEDFLNQVAKGTASADIIEDGQVVGNYGEELSELDANIGEVLKLVDESFAISLSHLWERHLNKRLGTNRYSQPDAFEYARNNGWAPHEKELDELRLAANVAKHSEGHSADELYSKRPDLFDPSALSRSSGKPGYDSLKLSDAIVRGFFKSVRGSGPPR